MKHTALYLRVSTEAQADEGYSLAAQAEKLEAYCRMKGIMQFRRYALHPAVGFQLFRLGGERITLVRLRFGGYAQI